MVKVYKIPQYAKTSAKRGLRLNSQLKESKRASLTIKEAKDLNITSGRQRARQIITNKYISLEDAKRVIAFYDRFRNLKTYKSEIALLLWGGREFAKSLKKKIK